MATQTFEKLLEKALLNAAKTGANVNYYNFAGATITGNIYINNGVPHVSTKPAVVTESKTETVATKTKKKQDHETVATPVVEPVKAPEAFSNDEQIESEDEEIEDLDDGNSSELLSQEIQVTFDNQLANDETHVYNRLREIGNDLEGAQKIKLKKKLSKCGDTFKTLDPSTPISVVFSKLDFDSPDDFYVCNFKDLQTFKDVVNLLSVSL